MTNLYFAVLVVACYAILYLAARGGRETLLITMTFLCTISFLFAAKIVRVAGLPLVPSAPFMAITFYSGTLMQEFFGKPEARKILFINLGAMIGFTALGLLARYMEMYVPLNVQQDAVGHAYDTLLDFFPQALLAALCAFSTAYGLNYLITKSLHKLTGNRFFALRSFLSVAISNLWDITAFVAVAYTWTADAPKTILTTWAMRLTCVAVGVPVMWAIKRHYQRIGL